MGSEPTEPRVAIIDDDHARARALDAALAELGLPAQRMPALAALGEALSHRISAVVIHLTRESLHGTDVALALGHCRGSSRGDRSRAARPRAIVVVLPSRDPALERTLRGAGCESVLVDPVGAGEVARAVAAALHFDGDFDGTVSFDGALRFDGTVDTR
jgi:CheY-like chemotaxis protein